MSAAFADDFVFFFYLHPFAYSCFGYVAIDLGFIERRTDDILGLETSTEYKAIKKKLGGTRTNRVFLAFGVTAPQRIAGMKHKEAEDKEKGKQLIKATKASEGGGSSYATASLEQRKRKHKTKGASGRKCSRLIDAVPSGPPRFKTRGTPKMLWKPAPSRRLPCRWRRLTLRSIW